MTCRECVAEMAPASCKVSTICTEETAAVVPMSRPPSGEAWPSGGTRSTRNNRI